jgi:hypothetical protein
MLISEMDHLEVASFSEFSKFHVIEPSTGEGYDHSQHLEPIRITLRL